MFPLCLLFVSHVLQITGHVDWCTVTDIKIHAMSAGLQDFFCHNLIPDGMIQYFHFNNKAKLAPFISR